MTTAALYILYAFLAIGAAGLYLCLPSGRPAGHPLRWSGRILAAAAVAVLAVYWTRWIGGAFEGRAFFVIFAIIAIVAAGRVVTHPRPIYCALYFILVVLAVTGLCILAGAEFLAAGLVIVYAGAILVVYVFVIMLAQQKTAVPSDWTSREPVAAVTLGFLLAATVTQAMASREPIIRDVPGAETPGIMTIAARPGDFDSAAAHTLAVEPLDLSSGLRPPVPPGRESTGPRRIDPEAANAGKGNVRAVGETMMTMYVMAVETAGVLLLVALIGAVGMARKRIEPAALTPEERAAADAVVDVHQRGREAPPF